MISELDNIKKGLVVSTVEYDTSKKIIGVATTNLSPGPNGIAPLEKQGAFQVPATETIDFAQAIDAVQAQAAEQIAGQIELPVLGAAPENNGLKPPVTTDVILENPVQVENLASLTGFDVPNIEAVSEEKVEEKPEETTQEQVALDIQMPEMPSEVVADEPTGLNESLFEGANAQQSLLEANPQPAGEEMQSQGGQTDSAEVQVNAQEVAGTTASQPEGTTENIIDTIPSATELSQEIPAFNIEMPVINEQPKEGTVEQVQEQKQEAQETITQPELQIPETQLSEPMQEIAGIGTDNETVAETLEETETNSNVESVENDVTASNFESAEDIIKTYNESMETIIKNFNSAQVELLKECVEALRKIQTVKKEAVENKTADVNMVQQVPEISQQPAPNAPANSLESAAFEIIDAMSVPKM